MKTQASIEVRQRIGHHLRALRQQKQWTQEEAARRAGITSQNYLSSLERGKKLPSRKTLARFAEAYEANVNDLLIQAGYISSNQQDEKISGTVVNNALNRLDWAIDAVLRDENFLAGKHFLEMKMTKGLTTQEKVQAVAIWQGTHRDKGLRLLAEEEIDSFLLIDKNQPVNPEKDS